MPVRFITGRAGSGKSALVLEEIRNRLEAGGGDGPLVLLVPEQATFRHERLLAGAVAAGGFMRAQVLSFRRLAFRVMQETGGAARVHIAENGKRMLLHKLLLHRRSDLAAFHRLAAEPGFVDRLNGMLVELKRYRIEPRQLMEEADRAHARGHSALADKLRDLAVLYAAYEEAAGRLYLDAEDDLAHLAAHFAESSYAGKAEFWIDGFHGFTPAELEAVAALMRHAARVSITLCLDRVVEAGERPDELDLFHPTARTCARLKEMAAEMGVEVEPPVHLTGAPRYANSPLLGDLERALALGRRPDPSRASGEDALVLVEASDPRAEAEAAARRMIVLARDAGARWRDMVVLVRHPEQYRDVLATTLADYGIPHFFDSKRDAGHHPLPELIRAALETVTGGWRYESVFRAVKTGLLLEPGEDGEEAAERLRLELDHLENYVLACGIQGSRWTDDRPWNWQPASVLEGEDGGGRGGPGKDAGPYGRPVAEAGTENRSAEADPAPGEDAPDNGRDAEAVRDDPAARMDALRRKVAAPLAKLESGLKRAATVREMAGALWAFLEDADAARKLERLARESRLRGEMERAREHEGVWNECIALLDQLVEMMGDEPLSPAAFADLVDTGLSHIRLGLVPPTMDQVLIGSLERSRPGTARHVFLLGACDGVLPSAIGEDGILTEREREALAEGGLELAPGHLRRLLDEEFWIYAAVALASDTLWISWHRADREGKAVLPADLVRRIRRLFPGIPVAVADAVPADGEDPEAFRRRVVHPLQALSLLTVRLKQAADGEPLSDHWRRVYNWFARDPGRRDMLKRRTAALLHENRAGRLDPDVSRRLYGVPLLAGVSRMERFAACRFAHFAAYGLRLKERRLYRLEAPDVGRLYHAALSLIGRRLAPPGRSWGTLTDEESDRLAAESVDALAPQLQGEILLSSGRYRYLAGKLKRIVGRTVKVLAEHGKRSDFVPAAFEIGFGPGQPLPPLTIELPGGARMEVTGRIDRIDRADGRDGPLVRIIDYKSSRHGLDLADVYYGLSLQMLTYLDVVVTHARHLLGSEAKPGGVLYFHVHEPLIRAPRPLDGKEAETELLKRFRMTGLVTAEPEIARLMDRTLDRGQSLVIPAGLKEDGQFHKSSSVIAPERWTVLRRHGREKIRQIGEGILSGNVDIAPYRLGGRTACRYCPFKPVCHFDPLVEGNAHETLRPYGAEDIWPILEGKGEQA